MGCVKALGKTNMALKKSELYSSLSSSCDTLHGGMDASQYKDYVQRMLTQVERTFVKKINS